MKEKVEFKGTGGMLRKDMAISKEGRTRRSGVKSIVLDLVSRREQQDSWDVLGGSGLLVREQVEIPCVQLPSTWLT